MCHPLNGGGHKFHVCVDYLVRIHVGQLDGLPDLALQALGPGLVDREFDGQRIPRVLRVLVGEVGGHAVVVIVGPDVSLVRADPGVGPRPGLPRYWLPHTVHSPV